MEKKYNIWWGPPRKFSNQFEERKISWLELFFDLVYAIVISRTTHWLAVNNTTGGILDYAYLIIIVFWGWYNGSQYYDIHGTPGIRTRLMTLWQMMAVAALAVTLYSTSDKAVGRATIAIAVLQFFITYLWWSVGIYDKKYRKYNMPFTICYLAAFVLIIITLFIPQPYERILFWITLVLNFVPPFISSRILKENNSDYSLSSSMIERLGLFTIIVFGEAILGVINGMNSVTDLNTTAWLCFGLGILIVFSLWWIFFSLIADRQSQSGLVKGTVISMIYIITLASLGMIGASFPGLMNDLKPVANETLSASRLIFSISIALFLFSIVMLSQYLVYPEEYRAGKRPIQSLLLSAGLISLAVTILLPELSLILYLLCIFLLLVLIIVIITRSWFRIELKRLQQNT